MASSKTVVLITGANSGIGYAISKVVSQSSADYHIIMASRVAENGQKAVAELEATGIKGSISTTQLEVTDEQSIAAAVRSIEASFGRVDVLINNAAAAAGGSLDKAACETVFLANCMGPVLVSNAFRPLLLKSKAPYLINVSSGLGSVAMAQDPNNLFYSSPWTIYRMSKSALNMLTIQQHKELSPEGVKVFAVCPGLVRSNLRGKSEEQISAGGNAGDPDVSGRTIFDIFQGKRDADVGKFVHKDGVYGW